MINPLIFKALALIEFHLSVRVEVFFKNGRTVAHIKNGENGGILEFSLGLFTNNDPDNIADQIVAECQENDYKAKKVGIFE